MYQTANPSPNNDLPEPWTANWRSISQLCITTGYRNRERVRIKRKGRIGTVKEEEKCGEKERLIRDKKCGKKEMKVREKNKLR